MHWWWPSPPQRTDDEISLRVAALVNAGEIKPDLATAYERALRDEAAGKSIVMRAAPATPAELGKKWE